MLLDRKRLIITQDSYRPPTPFWIDALLELLWEELITKADYDMLVGGEPR